LRAVISAHCVRTNSPCVADPILRVVDWNNIMDDRVCGNGITCAFGQTCMSSANGAGNRVTQSSPRPLRTFISSSSHLMLLFCSLRAPRSRTPCAAATRASPAPSSPLVLKRATLASATASRPLLLLMWTL
jgi:hypothetical protein